MSAADRVARVADKLKRVRSRAGDVFGAEEHRFQQLPAVPEQSVAAFEARHGIVLPADYRAFITLLSGGGAGPGYGLVPFEGAATYERDIPDTLVQRPFPFTGAQNPHEDPALAEFWRREGCGELARGEYSARRAEWICGTLVVCHEGSGYWHLLVVNGAASGTIWIDGTVGDGGFIPLHVSFLEWYERWLDDALAGGSGVWWLESAGGGPTSG